MHTVHTFSLHFHAVKPCTNTTWENLSQYAKDKQPNCNYNETDQLMLENNTEWKISALPMWQCHFYYSCIRHCTSGGSRRGDEGLHPHRHTAIFAREKCCKSLAYLGTMFGRLLQPEAIFDSQCTKTRLATGLCLGPYGKLTAHPRPCGCI